MQFKWIAIVAGKGNHDQIGFARLSLAYSLKTFDPAIIDKCKAMLKSNIPHLIIVSFLCLLLISCGSGQPETLTGGQANFPLSDAESGKYFGKVTIKGKDEHGKEYSENLTLYYSVDSNGGISSGANRIDPFMARSCSLGGFFRLTSRDTVENNYRAINACSRPKKNNNCSMTGSWRFRLDGGVLYDERMLDVSCTKSTDAKFSIVGEGATKYE